MGHYGIVATVAQLFYAHRIYLLSRKKLVTGIVIILALGQLTSGIFSTMGFSYGTGLESLFSGAAGALAWGALGAAGDLFIAVYMSWFLTIQMRRSSRTTQVLLTRIKRLLLETGIVTAVVAIAYPLMMGFPSANAFFVPGLVLGKIYSNSILVLLNNRFTITGGRNEPAFEFEADSYGLSDIPRRESAEDGIREYARTE
ncbi:hypothetical protein AGABI2DRAFT_116706 [Agaricus bisporus var. bisporus H97]|uniref:hypothetical protein n=1 Tax=Agaricus bisporus var. bisporus (strain H97 / ATCC MYA-4626 / FGSC 10389) TaxID=936046 RepID=UPI00029F774C|nr:hypothetical protein AGABI2DRAFT_116706 [Agaricus bisporus var. bisporus H97]EKV47892.1 hypothetical protein AGABI2DRAFT_116706 [Agaricus bisporus var. bisporus H97]